MRFPLVTCLLEAHGVRKEFPGVLALDDVSLQVRAGTVHALMGENGAGKSTLMKIIAGSYRPDAGTIRLRGRQCHLSSPLAALNEGIAMIHQELNLMPSMTVAENIWIRREPLNKLGLVDHRELRRHTYDLFARLNIAIDPDDEVRFLTIAERQMVEIARAVSYQSDILIMDEPTSTLSDREVDHFFGIIAELKSQGKAILYITHKIQEVFRIADDVSVLRDGRLVGAARVDAVDADQLIAMMVGRQLSQLYPKIHLPYGEVVLSVKGLSLAGTFSNVSFDVRAGEIVGMAGLIGSGRTQVAETIFGLTPATAGQIEVDGKAVRIDSPRTAMQLGMAFLTEDRKETGLFLPLDVLANMEMAALNDRFVHRGFVRRAAVQEACAAMADSLRVKTPDLRERVENLSGGNQQKVLVGRWLLTNPRILLLDEPTRGIDVGAKAEIHRLVSRLAAAGTAVVMISSDLQEILGMSDRVVVMQTGQVAGIVGRGDATQVNIMRLAAN
jgi:inositol transport system ATP-binding protein